MKLVDTSVWIDFFNRAPSDEAQYLESSIARGDPIFICGIVLAEILLGIRSNQQAKEVREILSAIPMRPDLDRDGYEQVAALYRKCRSNGYTVRSTVDCIIAQICIRDRLSLLARDRDFKAIAEFSDLSLIGELTLKHGFEPLPKRGGAVDDNLIDKIRDDEGL